MLLQNKSIGKNIFKPMKKQNKKIRKPKTTEKKNQPRLVYYTDIE